MDFKTAKTVLIGRLSGEHCEFSEAGLYNVGWYLAAKPGEDATLDGEFSADELEAIAAWMRNQKACFDA